MPAPPTQQNRRTSNRRDKDGSPVKSKAAEGKTIPGRQQPKAKPLDFGKAIGINEPADTRGKVQKWQMQDGGITTLDDVVAAASEEEVEAPPSPKPQTTPKPKPTKTRSSPKPTSKPEVEKPKVTKPIARNVLDDDVRVASAPKKRVVSDSHWRKNRSPPKDDTPRAEVKPHPNAWVRPAKNPSRSKSKGPAETKTTPKAINKPLPIGAAPRVNTSTRKKSRPSSSGNDERPSTRESESAVAERSGGEDEVSSPTSSDPAIRNERVRKHGRRARGNSPRAYLSGEDATPLKRRSASTLDDITKGEPAEEQDLKEKSSPLEVFLDGKHKKRRSGHTKERAEISPDPEQELVHADPSPADRRRLRHKSYQQAIPGTSGPQEPLVIPETPPKVYGSRIEAWLTTTPDPFVGSETRSRGAPKDSVSTSDLSRTKSEKLPHTESVGAKDESFHVAPGRKSGSRSRTRNHSVNARVATEDLEGKGSSPPATESQEISKSSIGEYGSPTPSLKRRGAKRNQHSPTKDRIRSLPLRDLVQDDDVASSSPSSSVDASAVDLPSLTIRSRPDGFPMLRAFPSTGKRLSTIASVETFATKMQAVPPSIAEGSEIATQTEAGPEDAPASVFEDTFDPNTSLTLNRKGPRAKRKLASHADLISVLSMPRGGSKSIMSARSIRTNRSRLATATIGDLMRELASDEAKYMRELRTLVDGVIPVLLTCVLSKSDSAVAAGLFSRSAAKNDPSVTKPIVDMGIALQRLKSLHKRIPKDDSNALLSWAQSAQRVYGDYVKSWRLGFQDVVVNLAPATDDPSSETPAKTTIVPDDAAAWDEGLPRNEEGYVVNGDGERVDVAFLLKRPLVRLKYLAKTLKGINFIEHSEQAEKMSTVFQNLVIDARKRSNEEKARLEDDAAANVDPTRARDPHSLAPLAGVSIDSTRCVRARDYFDMHLPHSSGQEVDCHVELILRDDAPGRGNGGDVLLCEVDNSGRWLFFPPVQLGRMSARNGDLKGEIVVMIRGFHSGGQEWNEVFSLRSSDEQAGFEWVQMLGLTPIPPLLSQVVRERSFASKPPRPTSSHASSSLLSAGTESTPPLKSRTPSPREIEVPIGERANPTSRKWGSETPDRRIGNRNSPDISPITPPSSERTRLPKRNRASPISPPSPLDTQLQPRPESHSPSSSKPISGDGETHRERTPRSLNEAMSMAGSGSPISLKRAKAKRYSRNPPRSPVSPKSSQQIVLDNEPEPTPAEVKPTRKPSRRQRSDKAHTPTSSSLPHNSKPFSVWMPLSESEYSDESDEEYEPVKLSSESSRPQPHRRASSVPSLDLPTIPKLRKSSQLSTPIKEPTRAERPGSLTEYIAKKIPNSAPSKLQKKRPEPLEEEIEAPEEDKPPPPPPHRSPSPATPVTLKASNTPQFTPILPGFKTRRRSSSPLKHEYEPSTATESSGESEEDEPEDESFTSESSEDELEDDVPTPLLPIGDRNKFPKVSPPASIYTLPNGTISPSQSASQSPYRTVPHGSGKASKTIASIFAWSDKGFWESLHPDECSIVITPGLIEAFELTAAHSKPLVSDGDEVTIADGQRPLVALELTPLVPLRRGTALDISIRSPPTSNSRIKTGNNIMFRSRSLEECEALYAMINTSRINNPTYLALQIARGPYGQSNWASAMDRQNAARSTTGSSSSWWNIGSALGRRSSYRASSTRAASVSAATDSSVGTMASAFSALKRFSSGSRLFNVAKSTLSSRDGTRSTGSLDSGSAGSGSGTSTPNPDGTPSRAPGAPLGITNTKIRLYERETQSKWRDMGSARLTIMLPDPNTPRSATRQGLGSPGVRQPGSEKRILVLGKTKEETLLDVTLGESCFERVARTGIAVSVWEDVVGPNGEIGSVGAVGGVSGARARVYMIQMKTERECAYSFSLLGKLRY